jgi:hypothetical protein
MLGAGILAHDASALALTPRRTSENARSNCKIDARLVADVDMTIERRRFANICEEIWHRHD